MDPHKDEWQDWFDELFGACNRPIRRQTRKCRATVTVRGSTSKWVFGPFPARRTDIEEWRADGLEVDELINSIPEWLPSGLTSAWCRLEDLWRLRFLQKG
jgi:hypothetical protein